jgi:toxin ParE1/3/4
MSRYVLSHRADQDLERIWRFIAKTSPLNATSFLEKLASKFVLLASQPHIGSAEDDLYPGMRAFSVDSYVVIHRPIENGVEIVRVVHGSRESDAAYPYD